LHSSGITWELDLQRIHGRLEKRLSHGLNFTAAYTYSKLIDDASSVFSQTIFSGPVLNNTGAATRSTVI